jgi:hypothetical protein
MRVNLNQNSYSIMGNPFALNLKLYRELLAISFLAVFSLSTFAGHHEKSEHKDDAKDSAKATELCQGFGPQTPRDIDSVTGTNKVKFQLAGASSELNLCNIHFHNNAEHKAKDFSIYAGEGDKGYGGGYQCGISKSLTKAELKPTSGKICKNLEPGDTVEVHWVHSSCDVQPGPTLGSCLSEACANPDLRVETQVFTLVNDSSALNFNDLGYDGNVVNSYHQAKAIPENTGEPVVFTGSTTGPKYDAQSCSALQVTWSVRPQCAKLDINTIGEWCESNVFEEDHAHGVRKLVTDEELLSPILQ